MKIFTKWWVTPLKLTEKEEIILKGCQLILSQSDRHMEIQPNDMSYLIESENLGYSMIVNSTSIDFSNHDFIIIRDYRDKFIELVKETIKEQVIIDRTKRFAEKSKNENLLLTRMLAKIEKNG
jgi:hypothetical protein